MAGRDGTNGNKQSRKAKARRRVVIMGGAVGAFLAAAAMATGSAVTAAPAKADIDALLDPLIQPFMTSLTDAIAGFDPAAAMDLTSWTDSLLAGLNALDIGAALPSVAEPAAAVTSDVTSNGATIPLSVLEGTEPTVQAAINGGADQTLLVDTGSSGLVIPWQDLGSNNLSALWNLFELGSPTGISESGYSGGVDYIYLTYDNATVNYGDDALTTTNTPIDVEVLSWPTAFGSPLNFEQFLQDNDVTGILGIGDGVGPSAEGPLQAAGFDGVTIDVTPNTDTGDLIVSSTNVNPGTAIDTISDTTHGAPITDDLTEIVRTSTGQTVGSATVSVDIDSGGVYGTIPSSIDSSTLANGDVVSVYDGSTLLYQYTVESNSLVDVAPTVVSGTSIDSGYAPFNVDPIYINYTDDTLTFDVPGSISS